jgi:hypothetical protein
MEPAVIKGNRALRFHIFAAAILPAIALNVLTAGRAVASLPSLSGQGSVTSIAAAPKGGFWLQIDGRRSGVASGTQAIDGAPQFENVPVPGSIAAIPGQEGYWVVTETGTIYARGSAPQLCGGQLSNCSNFPTDPGKSSYIVAAAATPDGHGLWAVGLSGHLWTAGSAPALGDAIKDATPTGIVGTPSGKGYYIVMNDGGVYSFGDAVFYGSTGGKRPGGHAATGLALSLNAVGDVTGYWMVFEDGGVFTFGDAPFLGSSGGVSEDITSIVAFPDGHSYAWVHDNGQISLSQKITGVVITSKDYGTVWDLPDSSTEPSTALQLFPADGATSQQWQIFPTNQGQKIVQLVNLNSGLCADLTSDRTGAFLIQYLCKGKTEGWDNQRFKVTTDASGRTDFAPLGHPEYRVVGNGKSAGLTLQNVGGPNHDPNALWILTAQ